MKPADLRNLTWRDVLTHITEDMVRVHLAWQAHGPGTTREVAQRSGISLLTLRPRTTDLYKLGLVELVDSGRNEGIYAYRDRAEAEEAGAWRTRADFSARVSPTQSRARGHEGGENTGQTPAGEHAGTVHPIGYITVEQAVSSLAPAEQAALGARLLGRYGHLLKKRESTAGAEQLSLC